MEQQLITELTNIFRAIVISSHESFSFAGRIVSVANRTMQPLPAGTNLNPETNPLVAQLQLQLYQHCYTQKFNGVVPNDPAVFPTADNFLQELSQANTSRERWDSGWRILQALPTGQVVVEKYGLTRTLWPGEFISHEGPGIPPRVGMYISVFFPKESLNAQPGFYYAFCETVSDQQDDYSLLRFYWNIRADGASNLVKLISQNLNHFQLPFRFKCGSNKVNYHRSDAAVLYVNKRFYRITMELLVDLHEKIAEHLNSETPLFTKQLALGLGLAEDPGHGESFGMNRCRLLAEGIWNAYIHGKQTDDVRLQEVVKQFEKYGLVLEVPYLNAGSNDEYAFPNKSKLENT